MSENAKSLRWKDQRWKDLTQRIFERDNFTCICCKKKSGHLRGHHRAYVKDADVWAYPDVLVTTLCRECHDSLHAQGYLPPLFTTMEDAMCYVAAKDIENALSVSVESAQLEPQRPALIEKKPRSKTRPACAEGCDTLSVYEGDYKFRYAARKSMIKKIRKVKATSGMTFSELLSPFFDVLVELRNELSECRSVKAWRKLVKSHFAW